MELTALRLRVQTYFHVSEQLTFLPISLRGLAQTDPVPGQKFEVVVRFPDKLKIVEIPGEIDQAKFFGGIPTFLYICDGRTQLEYRERDSTPDTSAAPSSFEDLRSSHGLPELLNLPQLLSSGTMKALSEAAAANQSEYIIMTADRQYRYGLRSAATPVSLRISSRRGEDVTPILTLVFTDWVINPTIASDAFAAG